MCANWILVPVTHLIVYYHKQLVKTVALARSFLPRSTMVRLKLDKENIVKETFVDFSSDCFGLEEEQR